MGTYEPGKIPDGKFIDPGWLFRELLKLKTAINYMSAANFPEKLPIEDVIDLSTVNLQLFSGQGEWRIPILGLATPYTTTSTSLVTVGQQSYFDVERWSYVLPGQVLLEVTAGPAASGGSTVVQLEDADGVLAQVTINTVGLSWVAQPFERLPNQSGTMLLKVRTTNSSVAAQIVGANVLIRP